MKKLLGLDGNLLKNFYQILNKYYLKRLGIFKNYQNFIKNLKNGAIFERSH